MASMKKAAVDATPGNNPLLEDWSGPFGVPPFARIEPEHFMPAFAHAFADHAGEVAAVAADRAAPTFANTIDALETAGQTLTRVSNVFDLLASADTNDDILGIERELAPLEAKHWNRILMDEALFRRVDALWRERLVPHQELRVLLGVDVVRDHRKTVLVAKCAAQRQRQRCLAGSDRPSDADPQGRSVAHERNSLLYCVS